MERTKETLEARVRETPLVDRLKECQQRIGNMCAELRGPKMSIPVEYYDDDFYICTTLADAQATVEALQAVIRQMGEQAAVLAKDGMAAKAQVEALQRVRDEFERERDQLHAALMEAKAALDAEREKVKGLHEITKVICTHCCEPMEIPSKAVLQTQLTQLQDWRDRVTLALQRAGGARFEDVPGHVKTVVDDLTQLQALVRALPVVRIDLNGAYHETLLAQPEDEAVKELLRYRATLDATTPAPRQRQVHSCEIPGCVSCANPEEGGDGE